MEFFVLGVLEARSGGERVQVGGARHQVVLATLLLEAGRVVSLARLTEAVYGEQVPATGRTQVQICVSALRRLFPEAIETRPPGYVLEVQDLDLFEYERTLTAARRARAEGRPGDAADAYRTALALWRGEALEGLDSAILRAAADRLAEDRTTALEECVDLELRLGRHRELIAELTGAVDAHPLRERLRGQLMLALFHSGRQADALDVFRRGRKILVDELGLEPGDELRAIERRILAGEPAPAPVRPAAPAPAASVVPRLLPTDIADFTGRDEQIAAIERELTGSGERTAVPVVALSGAPGIGKTTLAVHAAHRLAPHYRDGQLYADLHGRTVGAHQVLERFLRALGVPGPAVPDGLDERAERYRDLVAGRQMLIVLDNAASEEQVRPLLPGSARSGVLVTSRLRLAGLPGVTHVDVRLFDSRQSAALLSRIAGSERLRSDPGTAAELADLCGQLPLAIRIAGARLAARPHWTVRRLTDRLADEARRLDELSHAGLGVRASMSLAYEQLGDDARRLFRLLAVPGFTDFAGWTAAALLDADLYDAQDLLEELTDAQLVQVGGADPRFRFHDLVRVFARERLAAEESAADREAALDRTLGALLDLLVRTVGDEDGRADPALRHQVRGKLGPATIDRLDAERTNIAAAVRQAAGSGRARSSWLLADFARELYQRRGYLTDWRETTEVAAAAAAQAGDERGRARMLFAEGALHTMVQRYAEAEPVLTAAAELFDANGDVRGWAQTQLEISLGEWVTGRIAAGERRIRRTMERLRQDGPSGVRAYALVRLAQALHTEDDLAGAHVVLEEALAMSRACGARRVEAQGLHRLGEVYQKESRWDEAVDSLRQAYAIALELGDPAGQAYNAFTIGVTCLRAGRLDEAGEALDDAFRFSTRAALGLVRARTIMTLGELAIARDDLPEARERLTEALAVFGRMKAARFESQTAQLLESLGDNRSMSAR